MIHPSDPKPVWPRGQVEVVVGGPVTCAVCGCRLQADSPIEPTVWTHFSPIGGRDARGCRVECADLPHDARGRAALTLTA